MKAGTERVGARAMNIQVVRLHTGGHVQISETPDPITVRGGQTAFIALIAYQGYRATCILPSIDE